MSKRFLSLVFLFLAFALAGRAQAIFLIRGGDDQFRPVASVAGLTPMSMVGGKLQPVLIWKQVMLKAAPSFGDGYIKFRDFRITVYLDPDGNQDDHFFIIRGAVTSDRTLKNCYMLIEFDALPGERPTPTLVELPDLVAGEYESIHAQVAQEPGSDLQDRNYKVHVFSGISEHISSLMLEAAQADGAQLTDSEILKRTASRKPQVLLPIRAVRPAGVPDDLAGSATIRCHVGIDGQILGISILKATNPAFGQSALDAVQQWIFIPTIKNHEYVEASVDIPIEFNALTPGAAPSK